MKTEKQLIEHYTKMADKIISSYGVGSDAAIYAMFKLHAIIAGMPEEKIFKYADVEFERLKKMKSDTFDKYHNTIQGK